MPYTVGLYTLGCKVSQYETEAIAEAFEALGFERRPFGTSCDVYVINTCTVTAEADRKSRQCIRRAQKKNPGGLIMVCGCYSQTTPQDIAQIPGVSYITGTYGKMEIPKIALGYLQNPPAIPQIAVTPVEEAPFEAMCVQKSPRTRAYIKIEDGCECRCTYCAIPGARGRVRSKPMEDVVREVKILAAGGTEEVVLTGIETASWGVDLGDVRLIDLLERLDREHLVSRIRLGSLSPEMMTPSFVDRLAALSTLCPQYHLSMQSGSDSVLRGMKRRYNTKMAQDALQRLRDKIPGIQFTTDLMVGFPGEGDKEFLETLEFVKQARFLDIHVFAYSRRPGTPAAVMEHQVDEETKAKRSQTLILLKNQIRDEILGTIVENRQPLRIIPETLEGDMWHAHSDSFIPVAFPHKTGVKHGLPLTVEPRSHENGVVYAQLKND